jgi:hypothetical protein
MQHSDFHSLLSTQANQGKASVAVADDKGEHILSKKYP